MLSLLPLMLERVGILLIVAFLLSRMKAFRQIIHNELGMQEKLVLIAVFGTFGIISNYTGVQIRDHMISPEIWQLSVDTEGALANTRVMGVAIGGLLGGPLVGIGTGLIASLHRLSLGGFTAIACGLSTVLAGIATGYIGRNFRIQGRYAPWYAAAIGIVMECSQMGIILLLAKPFYAAWELVQVISIPMIVVNGFGTLLFMLIIQSILQEEERTKALQTHKALYIAEQTLPYFRKGLNVRSCREVAQIILKHTKADAISITNQEEILAHAGAGSNHHLPMKGITTRLTRKALAEGKIIKARSKEEIQCDHPDCPLQAAIVLPLNVHGRTVGALKLYYTRTNRLNQVEEELAEGLSKLFSIQLELAEAELQSKLLKDAEIKALQAQVHPHFLFNAINTISALCRTDPEKARKLLLQLGVFFRSNLQGARQMLIPLQKEIEHVRAFLTLEQARFPDKYVVEMEIDPSLEKVLIPPFTLQPLVENAIRHAFSKANRGEKGKVTIRAYRENEQMILMTEDNGKGIPYDLLSSLGKQMVKSDIGTGTALYNIRKRIEEIYGSEASFEIDSEANAGTKITIKLPINHNHRSDLYAEGFDRR